MALLGRSGRPRTARRSAKRLDQVPRHSRSKHRVEQRARCHNLEGRPGGRWFEAKITRRPIVGLVYPGVYPRKVDGSESKDGRG
jgi:hypothetical protein